MGCDCKCHIKLETVGVNGCCWLCEREHDPMMDLMRERNNFYQETIMLDHDLRMERVKVAALASKVGRFNPDGASVLRDKVTIDAVRALLGVGTSAEDICEGLAVAIEKSKTRPCSDCGKQTLWMTCPECSNF